ncbi:MAG: hypothetical protein M0P57_14985 [Syntrophales bacterium]|jgi:hypothetical protein|nr:hypothetical protein [Syntrophales bacterium]
MSLNFSDALMEAKRRAQLQGRPLAKQEAAGIAEGYAESATDRLTKAKQMALQEQELAQQGTQFDQRLAEEKVQFEQSQAQQESQYARTLEQSEKALQWEKEAADDAAEQQARTNMISATAAGAGIGAYAAAGTAVGGPVGAAIGAGIGLVVGLFTNKDCIIVTACTSPDSYEVDIARKYRDTYLDETTLTGYYLIAPSIAKVIEEVKPFKWLVKKILVDRLIDYGESALGIKPMKFITSPLVTGLFLGMCYKIGGYVEKKLEKKNSFNTKPRDGEIY